MLAIFFRSCCIESLGTSEPRKRARLRLQSDIMNTIGTFARLAMCQNPVFIGLYVLPVLLRVASGANTKLNLLRRSNSAATCSTMLELLPRATGIPPTKLNSHESGQRNSSSLISVCVRIFRIEKTAVERTASILEVWGKPIITCLSNQSWSSS